MPRSKPICRRVSSCRECARHPQRPADEFCSDACARAFDHHSATAPGRERVAETGRPESTVWSLGRKADLQNSA